MRRFISGRRHKPVAANPDVGAPVDDLATWTNTAFIETADLPGNTTDSYPMVVDVTNIIAVGAKNDSAGLRFAHANGVRMSHKRTPGGRILLVGHFYGGRNRINYYWTKVGAVQPGNGFLSANDALADFRLGLIFESNAPLDIAPTPATFTTVGTPTYEAQPLGQGLRCAAGSYIETTAAKLRGDARTVRAAFAVITLPNATVGGRIICHANWLTNQRAFQLWVRSDGLELYASDDGEVYQRWVLLGHQKAGRNSIGCSWQSGSSEAILMMNGVSEVVVSDFEGTAVGDLFVSDEPYIFGGTHIPGAIFTGTGECDFEMNKAFVSPNHLAVWSMAWTDTEAFWGILDRTPNSIDVPELTGVPLASEVAFAKKEVTGISAGTPISVLGDGSPSYSIGSSFGVPADLKAKGITAGTISNGNWISTYHTSAAANSTVTESHIAVGSVTSPRKSVTVQATPGGTQVPTGPADVTVSNLADLKAQFATIQGGKILQIAQNDYRAQGTLDLSNRDFRGGPPLVIQASTLPYRGYLPADGGLLVSGETFFTTGSGGAEFSQVVLRNVHNVIIKGFRTYQGNVGTAGAKWYSLECINCSYITFENLKACGYKPNYTVEVTPGNFVNYANEDTWTPVYKANDPWKKQGRGIQFGLTGGCSNMTIKKSLIHFFGDIQFYNANSSNTLLEDVMFSDAMSDHVRNDGGQANFTARRVMFGRTWAIQGSSGGGIAHTDDVQNTTKTQPGWQNHKYEYCIFAPMDSTYPHKQPLFYEHDNADTQPHGKGLFSTNCLMESRVTNTIYSRPGNQVVVTLTAIIQNQFGGRASRRDTTWHSPNILVSATTQFGKTYGNNVIDRTLYYGTDFTNPGDQILNSTQMSASQYPTQLNDYPLYSSGIWRPVMFYNPYTGVIDINEIRRWSPKTDAAIHPNQKGMHFGASQLLQSLGALL